MEQTRIALLILLAGIGPLVWGAVVYWLMLKVWPQQRPGSRQSHGRPGSPPPLDYQI